MGSEVEVIDETIEEFNDVDNTVVVAVGRNVKESKSLIFWALQCFSGMKICLLHIHQPAPLITLLEDKFSGGRLKEQVVKACRQLEQQKMHKILNQYRLILDEAGVEAGKVWIEADNVEIGIVQTIVQHGIQWLVMGAASEKLYSKDMSEPKSNKAIYVSQNAPTTCQIWFACKGHLIYTREQSGVARSHVSSMKALSSSPGGGETMLTICDALNADVAVQSIQCLKNSMENVCSTSTSTCLLIDDTKDQLVQSLSDMFLEKPKGILSSELHDKLEYAKTDAENSKQKAFEESIKRWRAEEDAKDIFHKAKTLENTCMEEITQRKETEAKLSKQIEEIETMKNQRDQFIKDLQTLKNQIPQLEDQISKARDDIKELEEKIIQAVNLLITFKESRDKLEDVRDNARRQINRVSKYIKEDTVTNLSQAEFYKPSFLEIMEATQDFNQTLKIGEGRYGSVYKGILRHVRVAIKMLPSIGSQSDSEFEYQAEVLSRTRHPNIVTLIGVCSSTRSLIYEYLENGSLEDRIASKDTAPSLPWSTRIRIASEICSALIFLHANKPQIIHGNLTLTNVLLDSNHVSKLSDLGISSIFCKNQINSPEVSAYMDPECLETGTLSASSDVYSFGVVLLRILTGRPASSAVNDTQCAINFGNFGEILDLSAGDWPFEDANQLAALGLRCCERNPVNRPDLVNDIWKTFEETRDRFTMIAPVVPESRRRIPSYFVCPIFQEVMKDPYIAADGYTYEEDAIKGWLNTGHKTSPMTNLQLDHCDLLPNHALSYAIQEWQQIS